MLAGISFLANSAIIGYTSTMKRRLTRLLTTIDHETMIGDKKLEVVKPFHYLGDVMDHTVLLYLE